MKRSINGRTWEGDEDTLDEFARQMSETQRRRESVKPEELSGALDAISDYLSTGWSTGGGRRLRQFVWSLWNGHHLINLFDLSSGLDSRLSESVIVVFRAAMVGALKEDCLRSALTNSGEFSRWETARAATPESEEVLYPPFAISTDSLRRLAHSAEQNDRRIEQERRAEAAHETRSQGVGI